MVLLPGCGCCGGGGGGGGENVCCECYRDQLRAKYYEIGPAPLAHALHAGLVRVSYKFSIDGAAVFEWDGNYPLPTTGGGGREPGWWGYSHSTEPGQPIFGWGWGVGIRVDALDLSTIDGRVGGVVTISAKLERGGGVPQLGIESSHECIPLYNPETGTFGNVNRLDTLVRDSGTAITEVNGETYPPSIYTRWPFYPSESTRVLDRLTYDNSKEFVDNSTGLTHTMRFEVGIEYLHDGLKNWMDCGKCDQPVGCVPAESLVMVQRFTVHSVSFSGLGYGMPDVPDTDYINEIRNWLDGLEFRYSPYPGDSKIYASGGYETCWGCTPIPGAENTQGYLLGGVNNCSVSVGATVGQASFPCPNDELWLKPERCSLATSPQCSAKLGLPDGYTMQLKFVPTVETNGFVKLANGIGSSAVLTPPGEEINGPPSSSPSTASAIVWISDTSNNPIQQYRVYALHLESLYTVTMNPLP